MPRQGFRAHFWLVSFCVAASVVGQTRAFTALSPRPNPCDCRKLDYEIIVVEDSSPDGTYDVALRLQSLLGAGALKILKRPGKMGLGSAYIDGLSLVTGDFVFIMDADLSHHPNAIPAYIARQREGDFDVVSGTRYLTGACGARRATLRGRCAA